VHAAHIPSTIPGSGGQVAPGAETTGQAQIVNALGVPFVLEGLFGEADAEAINAEPDSELAADRMGMDVEDEVEGVAATADGGMIVDDDGSANNIVCVFQPTYPHLETVKKVYRTVGPRPRQQITDANANALTHQTLPGPGPQDRRI